MVSAWWPVKHCFKKKGHASYSGKKVSLLGERTFKGGEGVTKTLQAKWPGLEITVTHWEGDVQSPKTT